MSQEITPNIGLTIDSALTSTAKQNLRKIDRAFSSNSLVEDTDTTINADEDIVLQPGRDSEGDTNDIYLGTSAYRAGTVYVNADTFDLTGVSITGFIVSGIVNSQIAAGAAIEMSKISGLLDALGATATTSDIAQALNDHNMTYAHSDIAHTNRIALDAVTGTNTGDENTSSIKTKLGAATALADGYITSVDWGTFNGKQDALGFTPVNVAGDTMLGQLEIHKQGILFDIANDYVGTPAEGTVWWNKEDHTLNVQGDIAGSILQVGQENWLRARNNTGSVIPEGAVVYISGANTARATVALADASDGAKSDKTIGVATHEIADASMGNVTTFGLVRGLTTNVDGDGVSLSDGDNVYLSATTPGEWVKTKPHAPNHCVKIGQVINAAAGGAGTLFISVDIGTHIQDLHDVNIETALSDRDMLEYDSSLGYWKNRADITQYTLEKTGFVDPDEVDISYDSAARTLTFTHATEIIYLIKNKRISLGTSFVTDPHDSTLDKRYYLYFDENGTEHWQDTFPGFENGAYAAQVNYGTLYKFGLRECHGLMDWQTWEWLHRNMGTYKKSGGAVTGIVIDSSANLNDLRPAVSETIVVDEDLPSTLPALADNSTYMRVHFDTGAAVFTSDVNIFPQDGTNMQYNQNPISGTALASMGTNNRWVNVFCCAVPVTSDTESQAYRYLWFTGQVQHTSLSAAQAESFTSLYTGDLTTTILPEIVPIAQIIFKRTTSSVTTYNVQVDVSPIAITGTRSSLISVSGAVPTSHAGLLDRSLADQHPASAITNTPSGYLTATDVQAAIDALVAKTTQYVAALSWSGSAGAYTMTITGATHIKGLYPQVTVLQLISGSTYEVVTADVHIDDSNGNVTIASTDNFTGKVIIM